MAAAAGAIGATLAKLLRIRCFCSGAMSSPPYFVCRSAQVALCSLQKTLFRRSTLLSCFVQCCVYFGRPRFLCGPPTALNALPALPQTRPPAAAWKDTLGQKARSRRRRATERNEFEIAVARGSEEPDAEPASSPARRRLSRTRRRGSASAAGGPGCTAPTRRGRAAGPRA